MSDPVEAVLAVLKEIPELRPAAPMASSMIPWVSFDLDRTAVDVDGQVITVRVVALALPLPSVLARAERLLHKVVDTTVRLVVVDIDAVAFAAPRNETRDTRRPRDDLDPTGSVRMKPTVDGEPEETS